MYDILKKIKSETASLHSQLEQNIGIEKLQQQQFELEDTQNIVVMHYVFFQSYSEIMENAIQNEEHLKHLIAQFIHLHQEAYNKDLPWLKDAASKLPTFNNFPSLSAHGLGFLYVYMGSSLGNAYIYNKLKSTSSLKHQDIPAFFSISLPKDVWSTFTKYLDENVADFDALLTEIKQAYHYYTATLSKLL